MGQSLGDTLTAGQQLVRGESLTSRNGAYTLTLQDDGNLVLAAQGKAIWATGTNGQEVVRAEVQSDGNFVLYTADKPVWHTDTKGKKNVKLVLQDDRNLVLYAADGAAWSSKTETTAPTPGLDGGGAAWSAKTETGAPTVSGLDGGAGGTPTTSERGPAPAAPEAEPAPAPEPAARTYTVVPGDTLWGIAERFYGDGTRYQQIADASGVANPDLIQPGQVLTIP